MVEFFPLFRCPLLLPQKLCCVVLERFTCFGLSEGVGSQFCTPQMFQSYHVSVHLFDHVVDASEEVLAPFVIVRELLRYSNERFVVHVQRSGLQLWEAQFSRMALK